MKIVANNNEHARHYVDLGVDVGSPDLRLEKRHNNFTYIFYLELKKKRGKLQDVQITWNEEFDANYVSSNCKRDVAYGYDEAIEKIRAWYESLL